MYQKKFGKRFISSALLAVALTGCSTLSSVTNNKPVAPSLNVKKVVLG